MAPKKEKPVRLVVEGRDDCFAIINLMKRHGLDWNNNQNAPYVHEAGSVDELVSSVPTTIKNHDEAVGFVLDADDALQSRWEQVRRQFKELNITLPNSPSKNGVVKTGLFSNQRVGAWIMPNNNVEGTLEDFLHYLVPDEADDRYKFAGESVDEARNMGAPCSENDHLKSQIHTWLAWQESPGMPYGQAITAEVFDKDGEIANRFVDWFERLFKVNLS
jgi:hypothetical protein